MASRSVEVLAERALEFVKIEKCLTVFTAGDPAK